MPSTRRGMYLLFSGWGGLGKLLITLVFTESSRHEETFAAMENLYDVLLTIRGFLNVKEDIHAFSFIPISKVTKIFHKTFLDRLSYLLMHIASFIQDQIK